MAEYVSTEAVAEIIQHAKTRRDALSELSMLPTVDVWPVVRACWKICSDGYYPYCSNCKKEPQGRVMTDFCPNCGADMREAEVQDD